ncbi:MAG: MqnA/MqnD/SBP family protein [Rubricoccaceae bacterium]|nr:MqnA/MqnD/SBP family protein [Rubricoccaceae bacterium]
MRIAVWPVAPARALGAALRDAGPVTDTVEVAPFEASAALRDGRADLALVPTLDVLRDPDAYAVAPGVGLVGERCPTVRLVLAGPLDAVETVAFDPRYGQEVLLTQLLLREHYGAAPAFVPSDPATPLAERLAGHDAALVPAEAQVPDEAVVLDLGQEWTELRSAPSCGASSPPAPPSAPTSRTPSRRRPEPSRPGTPPMSQRGTTSSRSTATPTPASTSS